MSIEILASKLSDVMGTYRRLSHGYIHGYPCVDMRLMPGCGYRPIHGY